MTGSSRGHPHVDRQAGARDRLPSAGGSWVLAGLVALVAAACTEVDRSRPGMVGPEADASVAPAPGDLSSRQRIVTYDDRLARIAAAEPRFGGFWNLGDGRVELVITGPASVAATNAARRAVAAEFPEIGATRTWITREGDYSFTTLYDWHLALIDILSLDGVHLIDIDERHNRIAVGATDPNAPEIYDFIARSGVPPEAVHVHQKAWAVAMSNLRDFHRPTFGGLRLLAQGDSTCTLGFNGVLNGDSIFATAGHCSDGWSVNTNETFGQPTAAQQIGRWYKETLSWFTSAQDPRCPVGKQCRYEDVLLGKYNPSIGSLGHIGRPTNCGTNGKSSSVTITSPNYTVVSAYDVNGSVQLRKVGQTSGCTQGELIATNQVRGVSLPGQGSRWFIGVNEIENAALLTGDSGSAVFTWNGTNVGIVGLAFASDGVNYIYTPWSTITQVYGNIDVIH